MTLTATVMAGATPVGSGLVIFYSGATSVGAAPLNASGVATLATTLLPVGSDNISASFVASDDDAASTSSAVSITVSAASPGAPASYTVTASPASLTIARGQTGTTTLTFTPAGGYTGTLTLSCGNLPAYVTCTFAQNSVKLTGNNQPVQVGLTIETNVQQAQLAAPPMPTPLSPALPAMAFWLPGGMAGLAIGRKRKGSPRRQWLQLCLLLAATGAVAAGVMGCGGGSSVSHGTTPVGTSNVIILAAPISGNGQSLIMSVTITQ